MVESIVGLIGGRMTPKTVLLQNVYFSQKPKFGAHLINSRPGKSFAEPCPNRICLKFQESEKKNVPKQIVVKPKSDLKLAFRTLIINC